MRYEPRQRDCKNIAVEKTYPKGTKEPSNVPKQYII